MGIIKARKLKYDYIKYDENGQQEDSYTAVRQVDLDIAQGQFIAILGHNGSGKSTLAKHPSLICPAMPPANSSLKEAQTIPEL